jgi:hypothetical protein
MGVAILLSPLRPTPEWELGKSQEEQVRILNVLRRTELKWAKRCLWATLTLLVVLTLVGVIAYLQLRK